tara:strand:+ start:262 stop:477 length:216 start_codon:yes stop_codon:yes gene_type:complete
MNERQFFDNGYGVSIINNQFSYGLELAVLKGTKDDYDICYDTPITDDVIGYLNPKTLQETIELVKALPKEE